MHGQNCYLIETGAELCGGVERYVMEKETEMVRIMWKNVQGRRRARDKGLGPPDHLTRYKSFGSRTRVIILWPWL